MEASDIWEWLVSLFVLAGVGIKILAAAIAAEVARRIVNRVAGDDEDPP